MRNVSIDTKKICESGYKALLENGYEVELEDVFVRLDEYKFICTDCHC